MKSSPPKKNHSTTPRQVLTAHREKEADAIDGKGEQTESGRKGEGEEERITQRGGLFRESLEEEEEGKRKRWAERRKVSASHFEDKRPEEEEKGLADGGGIEKRRREFGQTKGCYRSMMGRGPPCKMERRYIASRRRRKNYGFFFFFDVWESIVYQVL